MREVEVEPRCANQLPPAFVPPGALPRYRTLHQNSLTCRGHGGNKERTEPGIKRRGSLLLSSDKCCPAKVNNALREATLYAVTNQNLCDVMLRYDTHTLLQQP